ncbi:MAG: hypothetical protein JWO47_595 [Candidatus Saccharibacteria bacterium]|nr:hypothetical protein [Candidatus Saccharibacteria bacterium]
MEDDLQSASDSLKETTKPPHKPSPAHAPKQSHKGTIISIILIVLAIIGGLAAWKFVLNSSKSTASTDESKTAASAPTATNANDVPSATLTETYNSTALNIGFKYPKKWKVTETGGGIRVESPQFSYPTSNLGSVDGNFRVYIRQGARKADGVYIGKGIAIKPSETITYTQPEPDQRKTTLLSSFGDSSIDIFSFFLIAGNFQLKIGDTLGPDYGSEPDAYIIAGGYTSSSAVDDLAMNAVALDYYATTNAYKQAVQIISSIQLK